MGRFSRFFERFSRFSLALATVFRTVFKSFHEADEGGEPTRKRTVHGKKVDPPGARKAQRQTSPAPPPPPNKVEAESDDQQGKLQQGVVLNFVPEGAGRRACRGLQGWPWRVRDGGVNLFFHVPRHGCDYHGFFRIVLWCRADRGRKWVRDTHAEIAGRRGPVIWAAPCERGLALVTISDFLGFCVKTVKTA